MSVSTLPRLLRREMLLRLMLPLLAIVAASGGIGMYAAQSLTDRVFDRWLLDAARSLAHQVHVVDNKAEIDLPAAAETMLRYDENDVISFSIRHADEDLIGQHGIPEHGSRNANYSNGRAFDAHFKGQPVRVAAVDTGAGVRIDGQPITVLMAETMVKRQRTRRDVMAMLLPLCMLLPAGAVAIGLGVRRTLRPLEAMAARWNERSHASLQAIDASDVPRELMPFASALNDLLQRIRAMLERERQFAANVAHQLRTPLAGIRLGLARAAKAEDLPSVRAVLGELDRSTQRTARLVQQLLALGRMDPEVRGALDFVPTDLARLTHEVAMTYLETALEKRIDLEFREPAGPIELTVHPELLSEAIGNLLDNALNYTPRGGRILIEFEDRPQPAVLISDSGPGIPEDERASVFERLVRGRDALGEGSGLGLAIVRDIAEMHQAQLQLSASPSLGGACMRLSFPESD